MTPRFHIADYVVFAISVLLSLGIGIYFAFTGQRPNTNKQYLTGGRNMHFIPVAISLFVSFVSTINILGNPAEIYAYGTQYMWYLLATVIGILSGTFLFVPLYYPLKITSVLEYIRMRFRATYLEYYIVALALVNMLLVSGIMIYSPCVAFQGVSGFPAWASVIICGVTATIYTSLGGMKSVVWTDVFQAAVLIIGLLTVVIKGTLEVGSISEVWQINRKWNRVQAPDFRIDPTIRLTFWSVCFMNSLLWMTIVGSQTSVQRFVSLPSMRNAQIMTLLVIPGFLLSGMLTCSSGITAFAYYAKKGCDPISSGMISNPNQILPFFVVDVLSVPGLPGLFISSLFSASLSSISTAYSGMGAILWVDVLQPRYGHLSSKAQANITKLCTFIFGILGIITAYLLMGIGGTLIQITYSVIGMLGGPLIGVILVGAIIPNVGPKSATIGVTLALALSAWIGVGSNFNKKLDPPLPGPVYNCSFLETGYSRGQNLTSVAGFGEGNFDILGSYVSNTSTESPGSDRIPSRLQWLYSISYFYYPFVGLATVFIVCLLALPFPCFSSSYPTQKKLLFPCLRRHFGVPNEEEENDDKSEQKQSEFMLKDNGETKKTLEACESRDNDVWLPRDEKKILAEFDKCGAEKPYFSKLTHQDFY